MTMSAFNNFPSAKGGSSRAAQPQTTSAATSRPVAAPYWAGTEASAQPTTTSPAHRIARKPVPMAPTPPGPAGGLVAGPEYQASPQIPRPASPNRTSSHARPQAPAPSRAAQPAISRFGSVRKAASNLKHTLASSVQASSNGPEISGPVPGSVSHGGALLTQQEVAPMGLVGLAEARANVRKYGQADHELAGVQAAAVAARAARVAAAEAANKPLPPLPSSEAAHKIPRKPVPASSSQAPPPPPRNPRRVLSVQSGAGTVFGDIIDAGMDSSWVDARAGAQQVSNPPPSVAQRTPANPPRVPRVPKATILNARGQEVRNPFAAAPRPRPAPATPTSPTSPLAATLAAGGLRPASYVPGIKCSDCGAEIDVDAVADHSCGRAYARNQTPTFARPSREAVYAANFPASDEAEEVIVDTFVREGHTSWVGVVRAGSGGDGASHQSRLGTGLQGRWGREGRDAEDGAERFKDMLGL